ncbi:RE1, partial [Symbiodinium microadriaticum]
MASSDERGLKRFSGDDADDAGKQLRKFRNWAEAKMVTMKDLSDKQKGPWIYTLLDGRALEAVEHLTLTDLVKEDGAATLWNLLTARFPEKESEDQMGEALGEVFALCAKDGETMQQWSSRVHEVFQKCVRKAKVQFPSAAQGWITLNCAGLSEEQKAIVKAKTQGKLEIEVVTAALRSCFPQYKASANRARRPVNTYLVDPDLAAGPEDTVEETDDFKDVEAFLADHGFNEAKEEAEVFQEEEEAAEALAVTWKERRKEISKLQQKRGFGKSAEQAKRSFRVEIEELKKRTRCNRCHRFGHWARECKANLGSREGHATSSTTSAVSSSTHDAHLAEPEFAFVGAAEVMNADVPDAPKDYAENLGAGLVSSPGFGVVDSGCGRTLIGRETLSTLSTMLSSRVDKKPEVYESTSVFRFGNGATETSAQAVRIPVGISQKLGLIDAAIIDGKAPLLLGRPTLERLNVVLNFRQLLINVLDFPAESQAAREVKQQECRNDSQTAVAELFCSPCFAEKAFVEAVWTHVAGEDEHAPAPAQQEPSPEQLRKVDQALKKLHANLGQKVPCVNIVDYASSLQVMVPLFKRETGELIRSVVRDRWVSWAGPPKVLVLDPARPNLGEVLGEFCNNQGIAVEQTATGSHWQLGKVERHGGWFQNILQRVLDDVRPTSEEEYLTCIVQTQSAKNSLLTEAGASPYQYVFGRNPRIPTDLLQDTPHLAASDAVAADPSCRQAHVVRQTARRAVLECQDDRALRAALRARPRVHREFQSGDWVYYWRTQKSLDGTRIEGGRWYGAAMVLGRVGRNLVVAHKRSIMRCSPEQLRPATDEESTVAVFPDNELLGIRVLLEKGQFPRSQFIDLVGQPEAPNPIESDSNPAAADSGHAMSAGQLFEGRHEAQIPANRSETRAEPQQLSVGPPPNDPNPKDTSLEGYGPVRRVPHKSKPYPVHRRPVEEHPEDFLEMMQEVVPRLLQELPPPSLSSEPSQSSGNVPEARAGPDERSPRGESTKREASREPGDVPVASRPRHHSIDEDLFVEGYDLGHLHSSSVECLLAAFMQKRMQKEIPAFGNPQELQLKVDAAKSLEWETIQGKTAMRVWKGAKAKEIRRRFPNRFMGSRFVITNKVDEDGERVKARLCLQGHLDPDFHQKIASGDCHSPTLSGLGRALLLQLLVSNHWVMNLGDIKGAFLEAGPLPERYRPLYAEQPEGGIPGLDPQDVLEVTGNMYGANNAPQEWYRAFDAEARAVGFQRSSFDSCLYFFRSTSGSLAGALGAHVDDTMTGGEGPEYRRAIEKLKARFPYRKWRVGNGEFCGVVYSQDQATFEITFQQKEYARHLRPIALSKERRKDREALATPKEVAALRAVNGAANWLSGQSRPDLAVQTSFSQQSFPEPRVKDLLAANQLVQRAKQHAEVSITVRDIALDQLAIAFHSDAGFANAGANGTQAGYLLAFVHRRLDRDQESNWSPFCWKSYKMARVVASTLAGEAQAFASASGLAEWVSLMTYEAVHGAIDLRESASMLGKVPIIGITDCKSLYDAVHSPSSPSKVDDKRVAIDLAIIKQCVERTNLSVRWCPTELMLADALTKDQADPADLLRAALSGGCYQLSSEASVLAQKKRVREARQRLWQQVKDT